MRTSEDMLFEIGIANGRYRDPRSLTRFDARVYSQNGEDGLIAEIFRRVEVSSRFVIFCTLLWTKHELCRFDQSATAGSGLSAS